MSKGHYGSFVEGISYCRCMFVQDHSFEGNKLAVDSLIGGDTNNGIAILQRTFVHIASN
jgi:hypothetical protein